MSQSIASNLAAFAAQVQTSMVEAAAIRYDLFNQQGGGALVLGPGSIVGQYATEAFFAYGNPASRRDTTSTSPRALSGSTQSTKVKIKLARKANNDIAISALLDQGISLQAAAGPLGSSILEGMLVSAKDSALAALIGCLLKSSTTYVDRTGASSETAASADNISRAFDKLGDRAGDIAAVYMHSVPAGVMRRAIATSIGASPWVTGAGGVVADNILSVAIGKPVFVTDSSALMYAVSSGVTGYRTLCLKKGAAIVTRQEYVPLKVWEDLTYENSLLRWLVEYSDTMDVAGFSYNDSGSTLNPTDANLATTAKWTMACSSVKDGPGVVLLTK